MTMNPDNLAVMRALCERPRKEHEFNNVRFSGVPVHLVLNRLVRDDLVTRDNTGMHFLTEEGRLDVAKAEQSTPSREYGNCSTSGTYTPPKWEPARGAGCMAFKAVPSRGMGA